MNRVAFIFYHMPYGSSAGIEGLNAALAVGKLSKDIGIFFIGDGVLQLNVNQRPEIIFNRYYATTFCVLNLYDIKKYYLCLDSLMERGLSIEEFHMLDIKIIDSITLRKKLVSYDHVLTF
ncbi:sulfurtransferase complex subunit TusC [Candidatus Pantoea edessiphila]|uniref:Sulfurtransferase complex subunit TusC n=1 Tax=Candidatus Pantoea edessiphila TaxID=2044610 RepID=A0A2P5SZT6_9GAMM|nr:sulfurtransferase complex subunit TusC [Candidatus Pantoea edessiphila]PPI87854.1 sulfurtransferase complex subunit TusC [Candidatus Pantoea edessiphila]